MLFLPEYIHDSSFYCLSDLGYLPARCDWEFVTIDICDREFSLGGNFPFLPYVIPQYALSLGCPKRVLWKKSSSGHALDISDCFFINLHQHLMLGSSRTLHYEAALVGFSLSAFRIEDRETIHRNDLN